MDNLGICMSNFDRDAKPETRESGHFYQPVTVRVLRANPNMIEFTLPQSGQGGRWLCVLYNTDPKDLVITPPLPGECAKLARFFFHRIRNAVTAGARPS